MQYENVWGAAVRIGSVDLTTRQKLFACPGFADAYDHDR